MIHTQAMQRWVRVGFFHTSQVSHVPVVIQLEAIVEREREAIVLQSNFADHSQAPDNGLQVALKHDSHSDS